MRLEAMRLRSSIARGSISSSLVSNPYSTNMLYEFSRRKLLIPAINLLCGSLTLTFVVSI